MKIGETRFSIRTPGMGPHHYPDTTSFSFTNKLHHVPEPIHLNAISQVGMLFERSKGWGHKRLLLRQKANERIDEGVLFQIERIPNFISSAVSCFVAGHDQLSVFLGFAQRKQASSKRGDVFYTIHTRLNSILRIGGFQMGGDRQTVKMGGCANFFYHSNRQAEIYLDHGGALTGEPMDCQTTFLRILYDVGIG